MKYLKKFKSIQEANQIGGGGGLEKPHVDIVIVGNEKVPNYVKGIKGEMFNCEFDENGKMSRIITPQSNDEIRYTSTDGQVIWPYKLEEHIYSDPTILPMGQDYYGYDVYSLYQPLINAIYYEDRFEPLPFDPRSELPTNSYYFNGLDNLDDISYLYCEQNINGTSTKVYRIDVKGELFDGSQYRFKVFDLVKQTYYGYLIPTNSTVGADSIFTYLESGEPLNLYFGMMPTGEFITLLYGLFDIGYGICLWEPNYELEEEQRFFYNSEWTMVGMYTDTIKSMKRSNLGVGDGLDNFGVRIISNTYSNGEGILKFDGDITKINGYFDEVGYYGLFDFENRLSSISLPDSVTLSYDEGSDLIFSCCYNLENVKLSKNTTLIPSNAFSECISLKTIEIPSTVTSIEGRAFDIMAGYCSIEEIKIYATTPPEIQPYSWTFSSNYPIKVPSESVEAYKTAEGWEEYADRIQAI